MAEEHLGGGFGGDGEVGEHCLESGAGGLEGAAVTGLEGCVIGDANCIVEFQGARSLPLNFRFKKRSTDYQLEGEMKFIP